MEGRAAVLEAPAWIQAVGRAAYRYRQHLQVILLALSFLVARPLPDPRAEAALLACSILLVLAGGSLRSWAMGYHTWRRAKGEASRRALVTAGPYAHSRNPLYLGSFLTGCGVAATSGRFVVLAAFAAVFVAAHYCIIRWEEGRLASEFGADFGRYVGEVPRLFPGLRSASQRSGRFDASTMMRCMEPVKTLGFVAAVAIIALLKSRGWIPAS
jgi:protein-S-isoprenylcysteine O-methyltransferase Ste14